MSPADGAAPSGFHGSSSVARLLNEGGYRGLGLGEPCSWPQPLRSAVDILLQAKFPMLVLWGSELRMIYNDSYVELLQHRHPAALGQKVEVVWPEIWPDLRPLARKTMAGEAIYQQDLPLVLKRNERDARAWFTFSYSPLINDDGTVGGIFCSVVETTTRVVAERRSAFRLSLEQRLRDLDDPVDVMAAASEALGRELGIARVGYGEIDAAEEHVVVERDWSDGRIGSVVGRYRMNDFGPEIIAELRAGRTMWVDDVQTDPRIGPSAAAFAAIQTQSVLAVPLFKSSRFVAMLYLHHPKRHHWDVSEVALCEEVVEQTWQAVERARAEHGLRKLNEELERRVGEALAEQKILADIIDGTDIFVQVADPDFNWLAINKAASLEFARIFGVRRPAAGDNMLRMLDHRPKDQVAVRQVWARALQGEEFIETDRFGDPLLDRRYYEMRFRSLRSADGQVMGAYQFVSDVTERLQEQHRLKEAEQARRDADALYRAYFENTPEALFIIRVEPDGGFRVEETNPAHQAALHLKLEDVRGKRIEEILPLEASKKVLAAYRAVVKTGSVYQFRETYELHGQEQHWDNAILPVRDETGCITRLFGSSRDVTRQVLAEELLRQSQKMEAMGQLTGGVAHDFNNLLTPIVAVLDRLHRKSAGDERDQKLIVAALQSSERARTLVQRLLAFARRQPLQATAVDVPNLLQNMTDLLTTTIGPQIKLVFEAVDGLAPAKADPNQLEMALLNLVVNARDAMPRGGTIRITASSETASIHHRAKLAPGHYIHLSVADTGEGMDEATLARAIEPFFSTKGIGKGTGLGLSMVHGLALQLGGGFLISSTPGVGTNVEIWLPEGVLRPTTEEDAVGPDTSVPKTKGLALLVDDEELVRMSTADMLSELGYEVIEATSADDALNLLSSGLEPQILVSDHMMPGMSGTELAAEVRRIRPHTKVLIISGYADLEGLDPSVDRLGKPFRIEELAARLANQE
jgi:PAS domain S-box-containing protein